jgi:hypothetical protein
MSVYRQQGLIHPLVVVTVVLGVLTLGLGVFSIWAYVNYQDQKNNVDPKIAAAVANAQREQKEADDKDFTEREKTPTRTLVGPEDLGRVSLDYPKTWSVFLAKDGTGGQYEAYLNPAAVPAPGGDKTIYALRVVVEDRRYEEVLNSFQNLVTTGALKAAPITVQGETGTRLDGAFSTQVNGSMVIFKVRDKTLRVFTESKVFTSDFDNFVLKSLRFNR